jgi:hypothetical protein
MPKCMVCRAPCKWVLCEACYAKTANKRTELVFKRVDDDRPQELVDICTDLRKELSTYERLLIKLRGLVTEVFTKGH